MSPTGPMSYFCSLTLRIWTAFWRREGSVGMDMWNAPMVQSKQPLTYRLMESVALWGPRWHWSNWQRQIAESGCTTWVKEPGGNHLQNSGLTASLQKSTALLPSLEERMLMLLMTNWQRMMQGRCQWAKKAEGLVRALPKASQRWVWLGPRPPVWRTTSGRPAHPNHHWYG